MKNIKGTALNKSYFFARITLFLFILSIISNSSFCIYDNSFWAITCIIGTAALIATIETFIITLSQKLLGFWGMNLIQWSIILLHNLIIIVDYFLIIKFRMVCNQDIIDIIAETNTDEALDFINSYLDYSTVLTVLGSIIVFNFFLWNFSNLFIKIKILYPFHLSLSFVGVVVIARMFYSFIIFKDGLSVPQFIAPLRIYYASSVLAKRIQEIKSLQIICATIKAEKTTKENPDIIVVIGESFSKYHCSLYGYEKKTFPLLEERLNNKELLVYEDAVAVADATHKNMKAIFSFAKDDSEFGSKPLFPAVFKAAGYKTTLLDNQYFTGNGITFLSDQKLSSEIWDNRNIAGYGYDGKLIEEIVISDEPTLYVIHLMGQHYTYANRYPKEFSFFKDSQYEERYTKEQKEIIAHYDNANLYNDYIINEIIKKFEQKNCILFYFSDHGEEVFELSGFMGHGASIKSKDLSYQLSIPFLIWTSSLFREKSPETVKNLKRKTKTPILTQDISHVLVNVASIKTKEYSAKRDYLNEQYDSLKHRIVMGSIDYDKHKRKKDF